MILQDAIKPKTVVWCKTEEEAKRILTEADRLGYKWITKDRYINTEKWDNMKYDTCYCLHEGTYQLRDFFASEGYTIIDSTEIGTSAQWIPAPQDFSPLMPPKTRWEVDITDPETQKSVLEAIEEVDKPVEAKALNTQIGGDHYRKYKIQPMEYAMANNLNACQFNVVKYITRYKDKNGIEDLQKAIHCINILIGFEEEEQRKVKQKEALIKLINEI